MENENEGEGQAGLIKKCLSLPLLYFFARNDSTVGTRKVETTHCAKSGNIHRKGLFPC